MFRRLCQVAWVACISMGLTACGESPSWGTEEGLDEAPHSERGGIGITEQELGAGVALNARRSLAVTETAILSQFTLQAVLDKLVSQNGTTGYTSSQLFRQLWQTQTSNSQPDLPLSPRCSDNGGTLNGLDYPCRTEEGFQAESGSQVTAASYTAVGLYNRFDLAPTNGADCGEYRIVFAKTDFSGGRNFIIFEAVLPNPRTDLGLEGCRPVTNFWRDLTANTSVSSRATALKNFYFTGLTGFSPVIHYNNYGNNTRGVGQVRTNMFVTFPWMLREFKLKRTCPTTGCMIQFTPVTVKTNPYGELFNPSSTHPLAAEFQSHFVTQVKTLATNNVNTFNYTVPDKFNFGQSVPEQFTPNDYQSMFSSGSSATFRNNIQAQLTAIGSTLTPENIVARAQTLSCGGCHMNPGAGIGGGLSLQPTLGFTHSSESTETGPDGTRFQISNTLTTHFLPHRETVLESFLNKTRTVASSRPGLEFIAANKGTIFWSEQMNPGNLMKNPVGGSPVTLASDLDNFWGVATDGVNVYWMDMPNATGNTRRVMKMPVNGGTRTTLVARENIVYLATDGINVYFIGSELDSTNNFITSLMRVPVAGGTPVKVAVISEQSQYLAVDSTNVYWRSGDTLVKMPKAGGTITTLVSNTPFAVSLASDGTHLYWAENDWATPGGIKKVPVAGGTVSTVLSNTMWVTGVAVDNYSVYWTDGSNPGPIKTGPK